MNELSTTTRQLPSTIPELAKFVLVGRDKLKAVRAEIHAIDKIGLAQEVREQKLSEAQEIAEVVTDAECRIGELLKQVPKASGQRTDLQPISPHVERLKPKSQVIRESGLTQRQAEHFQIMAENPDSVARAKERARKNGEVLSRSAVLDQVIRDCPKPKTDRQEAREARAKHDEFRKAQAEGTTVSFRDIKEDAYNMRVIGMEYLSEINIAISKVTALALFRDGVDVESVRKTFKSGEAKQLEADIDEAIRVLNFLRK